MIDSTGGWVGGWVAGWVAGWVLLNLMIALASLEPINSLARKRYIDALRADVNDSGLIIKKRSNKDVYINNFNLTLMPLLKSNHDIQNVINPRAVANYVTNYLTKNEGGTSKLLKTLFES